MVFLYRFILGLLCRALVLGMALWLLPACIFVEGTSGSSGGASGNGSGMVDMPLGEFPTACPRAPDFGARKPRPPKDAAELARAVEVCNWNIADAEQRGLDIQYTVLMPSGDIYNWVTPQSLGTASDPAPVLADEDLTLPAAIDVLESELKQNASYAGPKGLVPLVQEHFSFYVSGDSGASSLDEFLQKYPSGSPTAPGRLYAGVGSTPNSVKAPTYNEGATGWVMPYDSKQPMDRGTVSLMEMAVVCREDTGEIAALFGVAAAKDYANRIFNNPNTPDSVLRLRVEFLFKDDKPGSKLQGGWVGSISGDNFWPYLDNPMDPMRLIAPNMILFPSMVSGPQFASRFTIEHERFVDSSKIGKWWIKFNGIKIGFYWDARVGDKFLAKGACEALWYGETYNPGRDPQNPGAPVPSWPPMGSGNWAMAGLGQASFWASMAYFDSAKTLQTPVNGGVPLDQVKGVTTNAGCYTTYGPVNLLPPFGPIVFVGGPGGAAPNNICPPPP